MISIQLASRFLFTTGFHTKKIIRGPANDWYDFEFHFVYLCVLSQLGCLLYYDFIFQVVYVVQIKDLGKDDGRNLCV